MNNILRPVKLFSSLKVSLNLSRMSSYLIQDPKYSFLRDLGLSEKNNGVFVKHGKWIGDGNVSKCLFFRIFKIFYSPYVFFLK